MEFKPRHSAIALLVVLALQCSSSPWLRAQTAPSVTDSEADRERLYQEIAAEVTVLEKFGGVLKRVVRVVKPSVVHIEAKKTSLSATRTGSRRTTEEAGSGVIIRHDGQFYILTNRHVIRDSELSQIRIELADGRILNPTKVWSDDGTDVAIMSVSSSGLVPARLGDSDKLEIGDFVLAYGSPFGLSHSVTYGIISAKGRHHLKLGDGVRFQDFLQTDAAINPGNSGGPLLNLRGEVVGINTAIASSSGGNDGIGFTIPINLAIHVAKQLVERGVVARAYLGVRLDSNFDALKAAELGLPRPEGARVSGITPDSPAANANLQVGDLILKLNNTRVESDDHLVNLISVLPIGTQIELLIFRNGTPLTVMVKVGNRGQFEN